MNKPQEILTKCATVTALSERATIGTWKSDFEADPSGGGDAYVYVDHPEVKDAASVLFNSDWGTEHDAALIAEARAFAPEAAALIPKLLGALKHIANMPEHDQDDAHRLRHAAQSALASV